jgi:alanine dehydrogenase
MLALTNATLPYVLRLAKYGEHAMADADIRGGVNTYRGSSVVTSKLIG